MHPIAKRFWLHTFLDFNTSWVSLTLDLPLLVFLTALPTLPFLWPLFPSCLLPTTLFLLFTPTLTLRPSHRSTWLPLGLVLFPPLSWTVIGVCAGF